MCLTYLDSFLDNEEKSNSYGRKARVEGAASQSFLASEMSCKTTAQWIKVFASCMNSEDTTPELPYSVSCSLASSHAFQRA